MAAITIVAYRGIQDRAQDAQLRSVASQLEKAILRWNVDSNELPRGGWGSTTPLTNGNCTDGSGGWVESTSYVCSIGAALIDGKYIPANLMKNAPKNTAYLPAATTGAQSFMFYSCGGGTGKYALYWHLKKPSAEDTASLNQAAAAGCPTSAQTTLYRMEAAKVLTFSGQ